MGGERIDQGERFREVATYPPGVGPVGLVGERVADAVEELGHALAGEQTVLLHRDVEVVAEPLEGLDPTALARAAGVLRVLAWKE